MPDYKLHLMAFIAMWVGGFLIGYAIGGLNA